MLAKCFEGGGVKRGEVGVRVQMWLGRGLGVLKRFYIYIRSPCDHFQVYKSHWERKKNKVTNGQTDGVTISLVELLIAAKNIIFSLMV